MAFGSKKAKAAKSAQKAQWQAALADGRVVKALDTFTAYPTKELAARALSALLTSGVTAQIVEVR